MLPTSHVSRASRKKRRNAFADLSRLRIVICRTASGARARSFDERRTTSCCLGEKNPKTARDEFRKPSLIGSQVTFASMSSLGNSINLPLYSTRRWQSSNCLLFLCAHGSRLPTAKRRPDVELRFSFRACDVARTPVKSQTSG